MTVMQLEVASVGGNLDMAHPVLVPHERNI